ncbi:MAG: hypothetical protein ABIB47_01235 [Candidatus Woesearchaeota archaeon]
MDKTDVLDKLIIANKKEFDKELIANLLKDFIRITPDADVSLEPDFFKLNNERKVIVYLLSRKVMKIKDIIKTEGVGQHQISRDINIPVGSTKTVIKRIAKSLLKKDDSGYVIPNYNLNKIKELFKDE